MADVEKRLNSSLADLITQSKGSGTRGGRVRTRMLFKMLTFLSCIYTHRS